MALPIMLIVVLVLLAIFILLLLFYFIVFLRNPERNIPEGDSIVSPADGRVIRVERFGIGKKGGKVSGVVRIRKGSAGKVFAQTKDIAVHGYLISIFMSPLDVHYNRAPIAGKIVKVEHHAGKFIPAHFTESTMVNENTEVVIQGKAMKVKVILIAGFFARRIVTFIKAGQTVAKGERIGMIRLGSQATLILPDGVDIKVKEGDRVIAGGSIIAEIC